VISLKIEQNSGERDGVEHENADAIVSAAILPEAFIAGQELTFSSEVREKKGVLKPMQVCRNIGWVALLHILPFILLLA
jgi:hypothetical protein